MTDAPIVTTTAGRLQGAVDPRGVLVFRGVPFAADAGGVNRFRPPQPVAPWQGIRDATAPGAIAPQNEPEFSLSTLPDMSEDCLNLNVFTPALDGANRPVLCHIHAGAFVSGGGGSATHNGAILAAEQDVVVVSVNYRLGVFGFPPFRAHGDEVSNNLGLLDQIAALEWVKANIAAFGGDPGNVTLFGYSAGGWSIVALMASRKARGLFHRAAPQSGSEFGATSLHDQRRLTEHFIGLAGVADPSALLELPVADLLVAQKTLIAEQQNAAERQTEESLNFGPGLDFGDWAAMPLGVLRAGYAAEVPLLVGTTEDELGFAAFRGTIPWLVAMHTREAIVKSLALAYGDARAAAIWAAYEIAYPGESEQSLAGRIRSDRYYRVPAIRAAEIVARERPGTAWMYRFDVKAPSKIAGNVSTHATDLAFWFGTMAESPLQPFMFGRSPTPEEEALSKAMRADLAAFARNGACPWPAYDTDARTTRIYAPSETLALDPAGAVRAAWDGLF